MHGRSAAEQTTYQVPRKFDERELWTGNRQDPSNKLDYQPDTIDRYLGLPPDSNNFFDTLPPDI